MIGHMLSGCLARYRTGKAIPRIRGISMRERKFGKYFWHNMKLFTFIFYGICVVGALLFLWNKMKFQQEKLEISYKNDAEKYSAEIDNWLNNIHGLMNEIRGITWVKKLSTSSEVFLKDFSELQRLECQAELYRYFAADGSISEIAIYMAERGTVLNQQGWFSEKEYKEIVRKRCDIDIDAVLEAAKENCSGSAFGEAEYNMGNQRNIALVSSLIDVKSPPASLILILNRDTFNKRIKNLDSEEAVGIEVLNLSGEPVFYTDRDIPEGYQIEIASAEFPLFYRITFPYPSELFERYDILSSAFFFALLILLMLSVLLSFMLSLYNTRPLQKLISRISNMGVELSGAEKRNTEFEQIESSFVSLYSQRKNLEDDLKENYNLARRYALMLMLTGNEKMPESGFPCLETLEIPFTEDRIYFVWMVIQKNGAAEKISILDMLMELQLGVDLAEELTISAGQTVLIIGQNSENPILNWDETAEWIKMLALERLNILLEIRIETTGEPGIAGISRAYRKLVLDAENEEIAAAREDMRGKEIVEYINLHYCDPDISLKALGDRWNLSVPTVSRLCRDAAGTSFLAYLTSLRLKRAKELLADPKASPASVALMVGYTSEYSFRRAFQRNENCKLQDWIAKNRKSC